MESRILREAMTAYQAVYDPELRQQLEEKQAFENWVNSLVEEGHDLSEYTWEDMYEAYLSEAGNPGGAIIATQQRQRQAAAKPQPQMKGLSIGKGGFNIGGKPVSTGVSPIFQRPGAKPPATPATKPAATTPTARPSTSATARPTAAPKPAAPASKPAPTASATPSSATPAAPKRTFNPLMQKTFGYQTGYAPSQVKGDIKKMAQMGSLKAGFDLFDVVKGHLLDEGYADTEEAALAIMANMSEEWRDSIISEAPGEWFGGLRDKARASRAAQIQSMQPTPKPGPNVSSPFAKPASRNDSGRLTTYGAGGGAAAERSGQTRAQVMQQGAKNLETKNKPNPGPNFGR